MNYSELLQLAKGWGNFISDRIIIWRLLLKERKGGIHQISSWKAVYRPMIYEGHLTDNRGRPYIGIVVFKNILGKTAERAL